MIEEDNNSIVTLKEQQAYDEMKTKTVQAVTEHCEIAVTSKYLSLVTCTDLSNCLVK